MNVDDLEDDFDFVPVTKGGKKFGKREETDRAETLYSEPCPRCRGTGHYNAPSSLGHMCFLCNGKGVRLFKQPKAKREANRLKASERKEKKEQENLETFEATHPEIKAWWSSTDFEFAVSMRAAVRKFGSLTENQLAATLRCIEKSRARLEEKVARIESAPVVSVEEVERVFARAKLSGLRSPALLLLFREDGELRLAPAGQRSKNYGSIYVQANGQYMGRITDGKFFRVRDCSAEDEAEILKTLARPLESAQAYGFKTGRCSCCGRELTNAESIRIGIGPICYGRFFG